MTFHCLVMYCILSLDVKCIAHSLSNSVYCLHFFTCRFDMNVTKPTPPLCFIFHSLNVLIALIFYLILSL